MSKQEIKDWRGTKIEVGDVILYAVKHSTSVEVNEAIVKEVGRKAPSWMRNPGESDLKAYVIAEWHNSSYAYSADHGRWVDSGRSIKLVTLNNFEGITVVAKHTGPAFSREADFTAWARA